MRGRLTKKESYTLLTALAFSIMGAAGLWLLMGDAGLTEARAGLFFKIAVVVLILLEAGVCRLMAKDAAGAKRDFKYALIFGTLFGIATDAGYQMKVSEMTLPGVKGKLMIFVTGLFLSVLLLPATYRIFRFIGGGYGESKVTDPGYGKGLKVFFISWAVIQICWIPAFLAYYPAIMSYDFHRQFGEAVKGYIWFYEYQPLAHTFLIRMFYLLGTKLGNLAAGMAVFALLQSLILSASLSLCLSCVYRKMGRAVYIIWLLMFAFLPFNPILAISMTKDILFAAFFVLTVYSAMKMNEKPTVFIAAVFLVTGILNILFRNNAPYALLFLAPAFLITGKGVKKKLVCALLTLVMVASGVACKNTIRTTMNAIPGSQTEMFSVPIVQMVRVIKYQENNLTPEQREILLKYIPDFIWGIYYPPIADGPKSNVAMYKEDVWLEDPVQLLKDYVKIGAAYPNDYIDAFLALTAGYWFIEDRTYSDMLGFGDDTNMGMLYTFNNSYNETCPDGIPSHSYLPGLLRMYSHIVNGNSYYGWPVLTYLMRPAFYFWIFVLALFAAVYKRSRNSILVFAYPLFYLMTMFLGPCVNFRYMYPYIAVMPLLVSFVFAEKNRKTVKGSEEAK